MSPMAIAAIVVAAGLLVYLVYALVCAEAF